MGKSKVVMPRKLSVDPAKMAIVITNTLNGVALDAKVDFLVTTQTWQHKASFAITSPSPYVRQVGTDDEIYRYVNDGTRAHTIRPHGKVLVFSTPFRSKTLPRTIASGPGSKGGTQVITRGPVNHPGTAPREFDKAIAMKWDKLFATVMQRAIDSAVQ